jgi:hypothetical protein
MGERRSAGTFGGVVPRNDVQMTSRIRCVTSAANEPSPRVTALHAYFFVTDTADIYPISRIATHIEHMTGAHRVRTTVPALYPWRVSIGSCFPAALSHSSSAFPSPTLPSRENRLPQMTTPAACLTFPPRPQRLLRDERASQSAGIADRACPVISSTMRGHSSGG